MPLRNVDVAERARTAFKLPHYPVGESMANLPTPAETPLQMQRGQELTDIAKMRVQKSSRAIFFSE